MSGAQCRFYPLMSAGQFCESGLKNTSICYTLACTFAENLSEKFYNKELY